MVNTIDCSEYVTKFLVDKGIRDVFFIDGSACASLIVAVARNKNLRYYCPLHEQAGSFAVDGYFKSSGKLSTMIATSGPGGQNLLNGIAAAYYDSIPALFFTGQINSRFIKPSTTIRQHGFQENDIVSMSKPITKYATIIKDANKIGYELEKAFHIATIGRPGPVLIDIPMDIQKTLINEKKLDKFIIPNQKFDIDDLRKKIRMCIQFLIESKRPSILIGGGIWLSKANKEVKSLIKKLKIPFFVTWNMIDFCEESFPFYGGRVGTYGGNGRNFGIQNSDFLLTIGSRISGRITGGMMETFARDAKKIIVDIDSEELRYQQVKGDLNICCDAKIFVNEFLKLINDESIIFPEYNWWISKIDYWKKKYPIVIDEYWKQKGIVNPYIFIKVLSEEMKEGDIMVHEAGGNCVVTSQSFEAKPNQRIFSNNGNSSLGYALPAAIGACIATNKNIICICGDGGLNFNIQELQTVRYHNLPIKIFVFNNYSYGITKLYRDTNFQSEYAGVDPEHGVSSPDFIKLANSYDIKAIRIIDHTDIRDKIKLVLEYDGPILCDINMRGYYDYKPRLGWNSPIEDQYPFLPRDEFKKNMIIEPTKGWEMLK